MNDQPMTPLDWYAKILARYADKPLEVLGETLFDTDVKGDFWEKLFESPEPYGCLILGVDVGLDPKDKDTSYYRVMDRTRYMFLLKVGDMYWSNGVLPNESPFVAFVPPRQNFNLVWDPRRTAHPHLRPGSCKLRVRGWTCTEREIGRP